MKHITHRGYPAKRALSAMRKQDTIDIDFLRISQILHDTHYVD